MEVAIKKDDPLGSSPKKQIYFYDNAWRKSDGREHRVATDAREPEPQHDPVQYRAGKWDCGWLATLSNMNCTNDRTTPTIEVSVRSAVHAYQTTATLQ